MKRIFTIIITLLLFSLNLYAQDSLHLFAVMAGEKAGDHFSIVKGLGDVNKDGFDDVIVGSPNGSYAKLYFGGNPFDTSNNIKFNIPETSNSDDAFGWSFAGGDINGDGYNDILISNPFYGDFHSGRVYLYRGGEEIDTVPDMTLEYFGFYYGFGVALETGDVNGDGIDDLLIGAPNDDYDGRGRVFVYYGGKDFNNVPEVMFEGESETMLGSSISIIGDINKDGYNDILIGAPSAEYKGRAHLVYGQENLSSDSSAVFKDTTTYYFGRYTSKLGDMNNDGYSDFAVMSLDTLNIYSGKDFETIIGKPAGNVFWHFMSITGGKDLNGDTFPDLAIGLEKVIGNIDYGGTLEIYYGGNEFDMEPDIVINGERNLQYFASTIDYAGDVNGDGYEDIIVGESSSSGKAYLYSMNTAISVIPENSNTPGDYLLYQNYPNPFNPTTKITFELSKEIFVNLSIYNLLGERVETLINENRKTGKYEVKFSGYNLSSGIYFYTLRTNDIIITRKMLLIK